jgi:hypothetical protein
VLAPDEHTVQDSPRYRLVRGIYEPTRAELATAKSTCSMSGRTLDRRGNNLLGDLRRRHGLMEIGGGRNGYRSSFCQQCRQDFRIKTRMRGLGLDPNMLASRYLILPNLDSILTRLRACVIMS